MDRLTYRQLADGLAAIDEWLRTEGLGQFDRIRIHKRNLAMLADAVDQGTLDQTMEHATTEKYREVMCSLVESVEFVDSIKALRSQGCRIPRLVLEHALQGPADLHFEDERSSHGRNTMFEIAIAGRVARNGLRPELGGEPDVRFDLGGRHVFIQCKRVFSEKSIVHRLNDAARQLKRDLGRSADPGDCGIIAISISRVFNQGDQMLVARDEDSLRDRLRMEIAEVVHRHQSALRAVTEPRTAGVLFHLAAPAFLENIGPYMAATP